MGRGRPAKIVDPKRVIYLASIGHTLEEIAALEDVSYRTLHRNFGSQCEKGRKLCEAQIRRKQVEKAVAGNGDTTMLIWLGKQLLGQKDKQEVETNCPERLEVMAGCRSPGEKTMCLALTNPTDGDACRMACSPTGNRIGSG